MSKPVLVLVMSKTCGACQNFKKGALPDLEKELRKDKRIDFITLEFPSMGITPMDKTYFHPDLAKGIVEFFPTFLLFPGNLWNNKDSKLEGIAKHDLKKNPRVDYSLSSILSWIDSTLKKDPLFSSKPVLKNQGHATERKVPTIGTYNRFYATRPDSVY